MAGVIRSAEAASARVRRLPAQPPALAVAPAPDPIEIEREEMSLELERLAQEIRERDAQILQLRGEMAAAVEVGKSEGFDAGVRAADDRRAEALALVEDGIERALEAHAGQLEALERTAVMLACAGLEKVLGDNANFTELIGRVIGEQAGRLAADSILRVEVSANDFPEHERLVELMQRSGRPELDVVALHDLGPGDCRIRLRLGAVDIGIDQQWLRLRALFEDFAGAEEAL